MRSRSTSRISDLGLRSTKTTKRKPNRLLVLHVERREIDEHARILITPLLGRRPIREAARLTDRGMRRERLDLFVLAQVGEDGVRVPEGILDRGQPLDQPRSSFEELRELVHAQLPR